MRFLFAVMLTCLFAVVPAAARVGMGAQGDLFLASGVPASDSFTFKDGAVRPFVGGALTVASDRSPWVFAVHLKGDPWYAGVTADNWFVYKAFGRDVAWFLFWGISAGMELEGTFGVDTGARAGAGVNVFLARRHLELYAQLAWNPSVGVYLRHDDDLFFVRPLSFPLHAGFRVWL